MSTAAAAASSPRVRLSQNAIDKLALLVSPEMYDSRRLRMRAEVNGMLTSLFATSCSVPELRAEIERNPKYAAFRQQASKR